GRAPSGTAAVSGDRVWRAPAGFPVSATYSRQGALARTGPALTEVRHRFAELAAAPGVRAVGGPWLQLQGRLDLAHGGYEDLTAEVRGPGRSPVDQPLVTEGSWLASGRAGIGVGPGLGGGRAAPP